jgi:RNA polymerase sigma-70 factor (ECF subfamily)
MEPSMRLQPATDRTKDLWTQFHASIRAFLVGRVTDRAAVDDLLQEVFVRVHAGIGALRDDAKLKAWIFQIARNVVIDHYRSRSAAVEFDEQSHSGGTTVEEAPLTELAGSLQQMIDALPEPYREAVRMSEIEGRTQKELAIRAGISLSGAKSRVQRGRQMLKDLLMNCCHFEFDSRGGIIEYYEHCCCCASKIPSC